MKTSSSEPAAERGQLNNPWIALAACLVADLPLVYLAFVWHDLPERVPMRYDLSGGVERYGSRAELLGIVALLAIIGAGLVLLFHFLPRLDPKQNLKFSRRALQMIALGTCFLLTVVSLSIIRTSLTGDPQVVFNLLPFAVLLFFALMGNYLTSIRPNYFAGIRTPWTLESDSVWRKTHRLGGKLMFWGSLALLPVLLLVPEGSVARMLVVVGALMVCLGYTVYYSYRIFREEQTNHSQPA